MKLNTIFPLLALASAAPTAAADRGTPIAGRSLKKAKTKKKTKNTKSSKSGEEPTRYVWTKAGLEAIPFEDWRAYSGDTGLYIKNFPFPGDDFTADHNATAARSPADLLAVGHIQGRHAFEIDLKDYEPLGEVPVVFSDPIIIKESLIDYRLQFANDIGSNNIGTSAAKGRLVNPAGRRLREHFYRFPDQCDATPIALEGGSGKSARVGGGRRG